MIPRVNIISRKANVASVNKAEVCEGCSEPLSMDFRGQNALRNFVGFKEPLDWLKIDLNVAKIITVYDYKWTTN